MAGMIIGNLLREGSGFLQGGQAQQQQNLLNRQTAAQTKSLEEQVAEQEQLNQAISTLPPGEQVKARLLGAKYFEQQQMKEFGQQLQDYANTLPDPAMKQRLTVMSHFYLSGQAPPTSVAGVLFPKPTDPSMARYNTSRAQLNELYADVVRKWMAGGRKGPMPMPPATLGSAGAMPGGPIASAPAETAVGPNGETITATPDGWVDDSGNLVYDADGNPVSP